jgi:amino acid transporter
VLSYGVSAVAAMLVAFCYAEFAADLPVAGGAFNYIGLTFGPIHCSSSLPFAFLCCAAWGSQSDAIDLKLNTNVHTCLTILQASLLRGWQLVISFWVS